MNGANLSKQPNRAHTNGERDTALLRRNVPTIVIIPPEGRNVHRQHVPQANEWQHLGSPEVGGGGGGGGCIHDITCHINLVIDFASLRTMLGRGGNAIEGRETSTSARTS